MYNIPHFKAKDHQEVLDFMQANPFVTICGVDQAGFPVATQVPVLLTIEEDKIIISGHVMRKQEHTNAFEMNNKVLVIFSGPSAFVSANWYTTKNMGSTWNYQSVQAKGSLEIKDEKQGIIKIALKYNNKTKDPAIRNLTRISKPGLRKYTGVDSMPRVLNGLGIAIISTSKGLITDKEARKHNVGGEILCYVD